MTSWEHHRHGTFVLWLGVEPEDAELGDEWDSPEGPMVMGPDGWEPKP